MNKSWVLQQLHGAHHQLGDLIREMEADSDGDDGFPIFYAQLPFVYRHLNSAWNLRDASDAQIADAFKTGQSESPESRGFPHDLDLFIHD